MRFPALIRAEWAMEGRAGAVGAARAESPNEGNGTVEEPFSIHWLQEDIFHILNDSEKLHGPP